MYHSLNVTVGNHTYNTWDDLHLIPSNRPFVAPPGFTPKFVDIPGRVGKIDISEERYGMRSGSWEFIVINEWVDGEPRTWDYLKANYTWEQLLEFTWKELRIGSFELGRKWMEAYIEFWNLFNGQDASIVLEDDPTYRYYGVLTFPQWRTGEAFSAINVGYMIEPYKHLITNEEVKSF